MALPGAILTSPMLNPPATATIPGSGTPAYTPDYAALAQSDPGYLAWQAGAQGKVTSAASVRQAAARALALNYGGLPAGYQDPYGDITPDILAQAGANPQSQMARLKTGYDAAGQQLQTGLAARGALHSGDLVFGQQNLDAGYAANQADAGTAFGQAYAQQANDPYVQAQSDAWSGQGAALTAAETAQAALPGNQPTAAGPDTPATLISDWSAQYGRPMYTGPNGYLYTPDTTTGQLVLYSYPDPTYPGGTAYTGV